MTELSQLRRINLLSGTLVNQIAAGEVIERPASVVKELVENCIDAGARRIEIDIEGGGLEKIRVRDNGGGIHPDDIRLAVMRHTTSKLSTREELEAIMSLGFRGEALSSIASVSDFSISSRIVTEQHGWRLDMGSTAGEPEPVPAPHPVGTTVEVRNLFDSVPARRKFLRSERTEFLHILEIVKRLVMSRFEIEISLQHNHKTVLNSPAIESDYRARIKSVMGGSFYDDAREVDARSGDMHLWGWLGGTKSARSQSDRQYLYLNNRVIRDRQLNHAIRLALEDVIPESRYPSYILHLETDPTAADVNVHPAKHEVRFRYPRDVHDFIYAALRDNFQADGDYATAANSRVDYGAAAGSAIPPRLHETSSNYAATGNPAVSVTDDRPDPFGIPLAVLHDDYVLTRHPHGPRLINLRKLRFAYLYSRLQQDFRENNVRQRPLLVPVILKFTLSSLQHLVAHQSRLAQAGLELEQSGPQSLIIRGFPALLPELDLKTFLDELAGKLADSADVEVEETILTLLARHGSQDPLHQASLTSIREELRQMSGHGMSTDNASCTGIWRTLSSEDLQEMLDD